MYISSLTDNQDFRDNLVGHGQIWRGMGKFGGAWANLVGHGQIWWGMGKGWEPLL